MRARDNPFRSERILSLRYRLQGITWPELLARCDALHNRVALVGPYGSGKTTLLEDLELKLRDCGFPTRLIRLHHQQPGFKPALMKQLVSGLTKHDILLVDGAEQLNPITWQCFKWSTRSLGGLIITIHQPGRLPTVWECRTSASLLAELAAELLGCDSSELRSHAEVVFDKHHGNLRESLREYYDILARRPEEKRECSPRFCADTISDPAIVRR